jgi:hypothetical protein
VILLLLFFSISSASSLIFSKTTRAKLEATFSGLALTVGGPATLWIVALVLFSYFYPEERIRLSGLEEALRVQRDLLARDGWLHYPQWKRQNDRFGTILGAGESSVVRNLLWYAHFSPSGEKLESPTVSTVFVYLPGKRTLKFQRIHGEFRGQKLSLHFAGRPSTDNGKVWSVLLGSTDVGAMKVDESHTSLDFDGKEVAELSSARVDALNVALYENDDPGEGDYTVVDLKRYSSDGKGSINLGIVSFDRPVYDVTFSRLKPLHVVDGAEMPMALRVEKAVNTEVDRLKTELGPWLRLLDARDANGRGISPKAGLILKTISEHLAEALKCAPQRCFQAIFGNPRDVRTFGIANVEDVALLMFRWQ